MASFNLKLTEYEYKFWDESIANKNNRSKCTSVNTANDFTPKYTEWGNHIPAGDAINGNNRDAWQKEYSQNLDDIYEIVQNVINNKYPRNNIKWNDNPYLKSNLDRVIYHCSSGHIPEY